MAATRQRLHGRGAALKRSVEASTASRTAASALETAAATERRASTAATQSQQFAGGQGWIRRWLSSGPAELRLCSSQRGFSRPAAGQPDGQAATVSRRTAPGGFTRATRRRCQLQLWCHARLPADVQRRQVTSSRTQRFYPVAAAFIPPPAAAAGAAAVAVVPARRRTPLICKSPNRKPCIRQQSMPGLFHCRSRLSGCPCIAALSRCVGVTPHPPTPTHPAAIFSTAPGMRQPSAAFSPIAHQPRTIIPQQTHQRRQQHLRRQPRCSNITAAPAANSTSAFFLW